jgi:hypothetical protein
MMRLSAELELTPLCPEEIPALTALMAVTFDADAQACGMDDPEPLRCYHCDDLFERWPPGCLDADRYTLRVDGAIAGAAVIWSFPQDVAVLGLLFVAPACQGCGAGALIWRAVEAERPRARQWLVAAPAWSAKTRRFYEGVCGFTAHGCAGAYISYVRYPRLEGRGLAPQPEGWTPSAV